jgi:hypothetical protein
MIDKIPKLIGFGALRPGGEWGRNGGMDGSFACPECGNTVEVPYLPRAVRPTRSRRGARWKREQPWVRWAWIGASVLAVLIVATGANRMIRARSRSAHERALAALLASADAGVAAGQFDQALAAIQSALVEAERIEPRDTVRIEELRQRRDLLARRGAEARLATLAGLEPCRAIDEAQALLTRVRKDPVLSGLDGAVQEQLERARRRSVESDLAGARQALASRPAQALALCERLAETAVELPRDVRNRSLAEAEAIVSQIIEQQGAVIEPVRGSFTLGSAPGYASVLEPTFAAALRERGYIPRPSKTNWGTLWDVIAPFRAAIEITESQTNTYQESRNRTSLIEVRLALCRDGAPIWQHLLAGQTRDALPSLRAYQASRIAVSDRRSPEFERLLYDDAHAQVIEKVPPALRSIPARTPPASSHPAS